MAFTFDATFVGGTLTVNVRNTIVGFEYDVFINAWGDYGNSEGFNVIGNGGTLTVTYECPETDTYEVSVSQFDPNTGTSVYDWDDDIIFAYAQPLPSISIGGTFLGDDSADGYISRFQYSTAILDAADIALYQNRERHVKDPHMSNKGVLFATLANDAILYSRPNVDPAFAVMQESDFGNQSDEFVEQPVRLAVYQHSDAPSANEFALDNMRLDVSGIAWEFSPDDGATWYLSKDVMNQSLSRFTFPSPTTNLKVRITGTRDNEWVQSFIVMPSFE